MHKFRVLTSRASRTFFAVLTTATLCGAASTAAATPNNPSAETWPEIINGYIALSSDFSSVLDHFSSGPGAETSQRVQPTPEPVQALIATTTGSNVPGKTVTVLGRRGVVCRTLNAYGITTIVAGPATSCPFATATIAKAMTGANPQADVHFSSDRTLQVASTATGRTYRMVCTEHHSTVFECTDRDGGTATVWAY